MSTVMNLLDYLSGFPCGLEHSSRVQYIISL
jgi:hypothetical protein